jgi:tetratricopeptide (TPR) repeat protein
MDKFEPHRVLRRHPAPRLYPEGVNRIILEEPKPIAQSLEWRLASRYWLLHGVAPFSDGSVPYVINNSGWAPRAAAELVLAAGQTQNGNIIVVEVGAGSGVFARQVLDYIQQKNGEVYDRLTWVCTDNAQRTVQAWHDRGQFNDHEDHVLLTTANAEQLDLLDLPKGTVVGIIANYALDSLPAEVIRKDDGRLHFQACVYGEEEDIERLVGMSLDEVRNKIASNEPDALDNLVPLLEYLEVTASFQNDPVEYSKTALEVAQNDVAMVNTGALNFLQGSLSRISNGGFILINDYGPTKPEHFTQQTYVHRFGGTVTCALNFPHLDQWLEKRGCVVLQPLDDEHRTIHTRMALVGESPILEETFHTWFDAIHFVQADRIGSWINSYASAGQLSEALDMYERHLQWCPTDWHKLAEAAQLLMQQFGQMNEALELSNAACQINPWSSTLVWNVYGSVLYSLGKLAEAEDAWTKALNIYYKDPSTWLNFSFLYAARGESKLALEAIAKGLAFDRNGALRAALLQKQSEILVTQYQLHTSKVDRRTRRHRTLTDAIRPQLEK